MFVNCFFLFHFVLIFESEKLNQCKLKSSIESQQWERSTSTSQQLNLAQTDTFWLMFNKTDSYIFINDRLPQLNIKINRNNEFSS